jgi:hypothetical protein
LALEAEVAWYLHLTRMFATGFLDSMPAVRRAEIKSEELFSGEAPGLRTPDGGTAHRRPE